MSVSEIFDKGKDIFVDLKVNSIRFSGANQTPFSSIVETTEQITFEPIGGGPWDTPEVADVRFLKYGGSVICYIPEVVKAGNGVPGTIRFLIPEQYRFSDPTQINKQLVITQDTIGNTAGSAQINTPDQNYIHFYTGPSQATVWAGVNDNGILGCTLAWHI